MDANISSSGTVPLQTGDSADVDAAACAHPPDAPRAAPACPPGLSELHPASTHIEAPLLHRICVSRKPETTRRLHRLRHELSKISPPPSNPDEAREEIVDAMARADLSGWTVPELSDPSSVRQADGSVRITLISHAIVLQPNGGFKIVDLHYNESVYFEMAGQGKSNHRPFER